MPAGQALSLIARVKYSQRYVSDTGSASPVKHSDPGDRLADRISRSASRIALLALAAVLVAGYGIRHLTFNDDTRIWFGERNPHLQAYEALERTYVKSDNVFFAIAPPQGDIFTPEVLQAVAWLTEQGWQLPFANRVDSLTNFQHTHADGDLFIVEDLVAEPDRLNETALERIRHTALNEPRLLNRLIAPDGSVTAVNINLIRPSAGPDELARVTAAAEALAGEFRHRYPDLKLYVSGTVVFDHAIVEATRHDIQTLVPVMFALMLIMVGLLLQSVMGTFAVMSVITLASVAALGLAGWLGIQLNPASGNAPVVILTLAVADSIHILVTFFQRLREGADRHAAIRAAMGINFRPVTLTSVTTAIGFLTMNFSDAPPFHDLGNIVAMGVLIAWLLSVTLLPALMQLLPLRQRTGGGFSRLRYDRFAGWIVRRRRPLLLACLLGVAALSTGLLRIELDDDFIDYLDTSFQARRDADFISTYLTGFDTIDYSIPADGPQGINDPAYLHALDEFARWLKRQPGVVQVSTLTDTLKQLNMNMHGDDPAWYRLPGRRDLAAQYLLLYEMSLPYGLDLNNRINVDKSATRFSVITRDKTSQQLRALDRQAQAWLADNAPDYMLARGTGLSIMFAHISEINIKTMLSASLLALALISLLLIGVFRSVRIGLISLLPNLLPAFTAFGIWGMTVGQVGLAAAVIVALTLGIVVDDTIHFISNYLRARQENAATPAEAVRQAFNHVGTALWTTTLVLAVGFAVLIQSGYKVSAEMGMLTVLTISIALVLDFLLLPALLVMQDRHRD